MAVDLLKLFDELEPELWNVTVVDEKKPVVDVIIAVSSLGLVKVWDD